MSFDYESIVVGMSYNLPPIFASCPVTGKYYKVSSGRTLMHDYWQSCVWAYDLARRNDVLYINEMPVEYKFFSYDDNFYVKHTKGECYLPETMFQIYSNNDLQLLPALMVYAYFRDLEYVLSEDGWRHRCPYYVYENVKENIENIENFSDGFEKRIAFREVRDFAAEKLNMAGYDLPHPQTKRLMLLWNSDLEFFLNSIIELFNADYCGAQISFVILRVFDKIYSNYKIERWSLPECE